MAENRDAVIQNTMVYPNGLNICPVMPCKNTRGMKTTQVVTVEPMMD